MVGGCVRDLLLGRTPKDWDIATSARPAQVKRTFSRNCRIIGRRFKLAHLHFDGNRKILEVSTFRQAPPNDTTDEIDDDADLLITRDNEFGTAEQDALRRDFTVNALFFDPVGDEIIDYVGGLQDVEARVIRTIGDPQVRFREDPVRILRAIKFTSRLGFSVDPATYQAMVDTAPDLVRAAPPRVLEEILRLLRGGHALDAFQLLRDIGVLGIILPLVDEYLSEESPEERTVFWRILEALDSKITHSKNGAPPNGVLLGTLFTRPVLAAAEREPDESLSTLAEELVQPFATELRLPRRDTGCLKRICGVQGRFTASGKKRFRTSSFLQDPFFPEALQLFELTCAATGQNLDTADRWRGLADEEGGRDRYDRDEPRKRRSRPESGRQKPKSKTKRREPPVKKKRRKGRKDKPVQVETIEPEAVDLSAFDIELSPRRAPSFGTIVEGQGKKKKRATMSFEEDSDSYRPPPPPVSDDGAPPDAAPPPPPPPSDGGFGDW